MVGVVPLVIAPLDVVGDSRALRARLAARGPADDLCLLLADAEAKLVRDAQNQADGQPLVAARRQRRAQHGRRPLPRLRLPPLAGRRAFNAVSGTAIGEAIIFTQPTSSICDLGAYRSGGLDVSYRRRF